MTRAHLCIVSNYFFAFLAGVGVQAVVAGDAVGIVLRQDVLASIQGLVAVFTVEPITHDDASSLSRPPAKKTKQKTDDSQTQFRIQYQQECSTGRRRRSEIRKPQRECRKKVFIFLYTVRK